jgi:predicted nucleotide-binding protein
MPEDKELVAQEAKLVSPSTDTGLDPIFHQMAQQLERAVGSMQLQNIREADMAARTAEALYVASQRRLSPSDLLLLEIFKHAACLFAPLTRALVFQSEGRFSKARAELAKGLALASEALATIDEYAQLPNPAEEILNGWRPIFSIFPILFKGSDASIRAEMVGYQGNIPQYRELLREAVVEYRQISNLPSSSDPMFLALVGLCTSISDNLETRAEVFSSEQKQRYLIPTGNKVFIIHGHDEAKWRELRDLLEDRFSLETVVLKEQPGAGETLIRKFEEFADDCCYAFALLTPDDIIGKKGKKYAQARPNVLFELGWFYGRFGRSRVCIVKKATTEIPSDLGGITSIDFQNNVAEGFVEIQGELERAGVVKSEEKK